MGRIVGEIALLWLFAAAATASFAPRGVNVGVGNQTQIAATGIGGALVVLLPAAGICLGLWWLLTQRLAGPLALGAAAVFVLALLLPHDLTLFFLPPPCGLAVAAWLLRRAPGDVGRDAP